MNQRLARVDTMAREISEARSDLSGAYDLNSDCEELEIDSGEVSVCLLVNRRTSVLRVIDFRAGMQPRKLEMIQRVAEREGIARAFTVVEREEAVTWGKMGFQKEGSIPGFYKRSDAYVLGLEFKDQKPFASGTRIRIQPAQVSSQSAGEVSDVSDRSERAYQAGRSYLKRYAPSVLPRVKVTDPREQDRDKAFFHTKAGGRDLTCFEAFGRGSVKQTRLCTSRGGFSLLMGVEIQECFDNAYLEALAAPRGEKETWLTSASIEQICAELEARDISSVFATSPVENVELSAAYLKAGFRRTGCLPSHMQIKGARADAFLWSRRLAEV